MPKLVENQKALLEEELRDFHNEEELINSQVNKSHNGRKMPHITEGLDRQEIYDRYGRL